MKPDPDQERESWGERRGRIWSSRMDKRASKNNARYIHEDINMGGVTIMLREGRENTGEWLCQRWALLQKKRTYHECSVDLRCGDLRRVEIRDYQSLFQIDDGVVHLRARVFPDVLVDCADDVDGSVTCVQVWGHELPPYALAALLGPSLPPTTVRVGQRYRSLTWRAERSCWL